MPKKLRKCTSGVLKALKTNKNDFGETLRKFN
jgi:hypothetical protein